MDNLIIGPFGIAVGEIRTWSKNIFAFLFVVLISYSSVCLVVNVVDSFRSSDLYCIIPSCSVSFD